jgi:predicted P-loop ATPase
LISIARRNIVNPPHAYFESLVWDKKPRLDNWLCYYLGAEDQPKAYLNLVGSKWMIGVVARIYEPGCKFDTVLILEGDQYLGKSRALEILATVNGERYFSDENIDFKSKDSLIILQGKLIIEMPELASFRKSDTETIKGFITRRMDEYRPPYGRKTVLRPRMFAIAGSVNPNAGYLTDPTGNRRYWPVLCGKKIDLNALEEDKQQLWAEAVHRYKTGERIWLLEDEYDLAKVEQAERVIEDVITDEIVDIAEKLVKLNWGTSDFCLSELIRKLELPIDRQTNTLKNRVCDILVLAGFCEYKPRINGKQKRKWHLKDDLENSQE